MEGGDCTFAFSLGGACAFTGGVPGGKDGGGSFGGARFTEFVAPSGWTCFVEGTRSGSPGGGALPFR